MFSHRDSDSTPLMRSSCFTISSGRSAASAISSTSSLRPMFTSGTPRSCLVCFIVQWISSIIISFDCGLLRYFCQLFLFVAGWDFLLLWLNTSQRSMWISLFSYCILCAYFLISFVCVAFVITGKRLSNVRIMDSYILLLWGLCVIVICDTTKLSKDSFIGSWQMFWCEIGKIGEIDKKWIN